jgi:hypothetical protein
VLTDTSLPPLLASGNRVKRACRDVGAPDRQTVRHRIHARWCQPFGRSDKSERKRVFGSAPSLADLNTVATLPRTAVKKLVADTVPTPNLGEYSTLEKRAFEVSRDAVSDWLLWVFSFLSRCAASGVCRGCRRCGRACAGWPGS